jgi:hypothetical protein
MTGQGNPRVLAGGDPHEGDLGGTMGKVICRIRVVRIGIPNKHHDGNLSYWRALTRHLSHGAMTMSCVFLALNHSGAFGTSQIASA